MIAGQSVRIGVPGDRSIKQGTYLVNDHFGGFTDATDRKSMRKMRKRMMRLFRTTGVVGWKQENMVDKIQSGRGRQWWGSGR